MTVRLVSHLQGGLSNGFQEEQSCRSSRKMYPPLRTVARNKCRTWLDGHMLSKRAALSMKSQMTILIDQGPAQCMPNKQMIPGHSD